MNNQSLKYGGAVVLMSAFMFGCDVTQTQEGKLPEVDVTVEEGQLPKYEVEQTQQAKLPDVDVDVKGGQLPRYDVDAPDVDVQTKTVEVEVPSDVDVKTETMEVEVPTGIEITTAPDDGNERVADVVKKQ